MTAAREDVLVRPVKGDDDLDAINAGDVLWMGAALERRLLTSVPPDVKAALLVAEVRGQTAGSCTVIAARARAFGYGIGRVYVRPEFRRRGVGTALYSATVDFAAATGLPGLMFSVPDSEPDGFAAAGAWQLVEHGHHIESCLDLSTLDEAMVAQCVARAAAAGIALQPLPPDASHDSWSEAYEFFTARMSEAPDSREGAEGMPYSIFRTLMPEPWQVLIARRGDAIVGLTSVMPRATEDRRLNTMFTGVHPESRGASLSAALKLEHARGLREDGWQAVVTQNMDQNAPILAVNSKLGFRAVGGTRDFGVALGPRP